MFTDRRKISFHSEQKQSTSLYESQSLTKLRVIFCTTVGRYRHLTHQPCGLTPINERQAGKVKTEVLRDF